MAENRQDHHQDEKKEASVDQRQKKIQSLMENKELSLKERVLSSLQYHEEEELNPFESTTRTETKENKEAKKVAEAKAQRVQKAEPKRSVKKEEAKQNTDLKKTEKESVKEIAHSDHQVEESRMAKNHSFEELNDSKVEDESLSSEPENLETEQETRSETPSRLQANKMDDDIDVDDTVKKRKKEDRIVHKIVTLVISVLICCIVVAGFGFYHYFKEGLEPLDKHNNKLVQVEIPRGTNSKEIGSILEKDKIIKSSFVFTYYVKKNNISDFKAGYYQLAPNMTLKEITSLLQEGGTDEPEALADAKIRIPEGYTVDQIATLIGKKTKFSKEDVLKLLKDEEFFNKMATKYPALLDSAAKAKGVRYRLEGYLFPATYNYYKKKSLSSLIEMMIKTTDNVLQPYYAQIANKKMTVQSVLTLASLVEKEGVTQADRQKIAQVFYNRLDRKVPLQSDISVLYALNTHKVHLSNKDTQVKSPYNLYVNKGFGPGPFNNPSESAVKAVLNPDISVTELYFLADTKTGKIYYAKTYEEHLKLQKKYLDGE